MSTKQNCQQTWEFKRTENDLNFSSIDSDSSSDEEPVLRKLKLVSSLVLPGSNGEVSDVPVNHQKVHLEPFEADPDKSVEADPDKSVEVVPVESVEAVPVESVEAVPVKSGVANPVKSGKLGTNVVQEKNKCRKTKSTTKKSSVKRASKMKRECITRASVAMEDLKEFSESLIKDLKEERQKIVARMKKDLANLAAGNTTKKTTMNKSRHIPQTSQAQEQKSTQSEPQLEQHGNSSTARNFIPPAGLAANNTGWNYGRESSDRHGYIFDTQAQAPYTNFAQMGSRNLNYLYQNSSQTSGFGSGIPVILQQRSDNSFNIPNQTVADNLSGTSRALSNSVAANNFRPLNFHNTLNLRGNEAFGRMHHQQNGNFH